MSRVAKSRPDKFTANLGFEAKLWLAADKLRNNMDAAEYKHVVLGGRKRAYREVHYSPKPFFVFDMAFYLRARTPFDLKWAHYKLLQFAINRMDSGSVICSTSRYDFCGIPVPPTEIQNTFGRIVDEWFAKIFANDRESRILTIFGDTLLSKLLSVICVQLHLN